MNAIKKLNRKAWVSLFALLVLLGIGVDLIFTQPVKAQPVAGYYPGTPLIKSGSNWTNAISTLAYTNVVMFDNRYGRELFLEFKGQDMVAGAVTNCIFQLGRSATGIAATNQFGIGGDDCFAGIDKFATVTLTLNGLHTATITTNFASAFNGGAPYIYVLYVSGTPNGSNPLTNYQVTAYSK